MNESCSVKSNTHQTMREVPGCTYAMCGNDMTANTIIQNAAVFASPHSNRIIKVLHLLQFKQAQNKIRGDKEHLLPHTTNKDQVYKYKRERQVVMKTVFLQVFLHAQMIRSVLELRQEKKIEFKLHLPKQVGRFSQRERIWKVEELVTRMRCTYPI